MANNPFTTFTPSRSALEDISNQRSFQSSFKTPQDISEEAEKVYGEVILEIPDVIEIIEFDLGECPPSSPKYYIVQDPDINQVNGKEDFDEKEYEEVEAEVTTLFEMIVTYSQDTVL